MDNENKDTSLDTKTPDVKDTETNDTKKTPDTQDIKTPDAEKVDKKEPEKKEPDKKEPDKKEPEKKTETDDNKIDYAAENATLKAEIQALKQQVLDGKLLELARAEAGKVGFDVSYTADIIKLADMSGVVDEDGKINKDKLNECLSAVVERIAPFKLENSKKTAEGFKNVGADQSGDKPGDALDKIRKAMGLK